MPVGEVGRGSRYIKYKSNPNSIVSSFHPEKLWAYEASKLKYYFAICEFTSPKMANLAFEEVDSTKVGHSSMCMDLWSIAPPNVVGVFMNRPIWDVAMSIPGNYEPPDFVLGALQVLATSAPGTDFQINVTDK